MVTIKKMAKQKQLSRLRVVPAKQSWFGNTALFYFSKYLTFHYVLLLATKLKRDTFRHFGSMIILQSSKIKGLLTDWIYRLSRLTLVAEYSTVNSSIQSLKDVLLKYTDEPTHQNPEYENDKIIEPLNKERGRYFGILHIGIKVVYTFWRRFFGQSSSVNQSALSLCGYFKR